MEEIGNLCKKTNHDASHVISPSGNLATPFTNIDEVDRKLLQLLQDEFPMVERPWRKLSIQLGISEEEVLLRLRRLNEAGIIRKIGALVDSSKIGLNAATLVAMQVPKNDVDVVARVINEHANISHNYEREHNYNVWFTIAASNTQEIENMIAEITQKTGFEPNSILNLPTIQRFKVNVRFQLT